MMLNHPEDQTQADRDYAEEQRANMLGYRKTSTALPHGEWLELVAHIDTEGQRIKADWEAAVQSGASFEELEALNDEHLDYMLPLEGMAGY